MKNKKLFAILTLVCFMFTLMPVAAFAANDAVADRTLFYAVKGDSAISVKNGALDKDVDAVEFKLEALNSAGEKAEFNKDTVVYIWAKNDKGTVVSALDATTTTTGVAEASKVAVPQYAKAFTISNKTTSEVDFLVGFAADGDYTVYAAVVAKAAVTDKYAELANVTVSGSGDDVITAIGDAMNPDKQYFMDVVPTDAKVSAADAKETAAGIVEVIELDPNNVVSEVALEFTCKDLDSKGDVTGEAKKLTHKDVTVKMDTANVTVVQEDPTTGYAGVVDLKLSASREGNYLMYVTVEGKTFIVKVEVGNTKAAQIETLVQPSNPIAQFTTSAEFGVASEDPKVMFHIDDINGNAVVKETGDALFGGKGITATEKAKYLFFVEKPAASNLRDTDLSLFNNGNGNYSLEVAKTLSVEGKYVVKAILDNGAFATAEWEVKRFEEPVAIVIKGAPATVELGKAFTPSLYYVDVNNVEKFAFDAKVAATGYAIYSFDGNKITVKTDEKYAGQTINLTAASEMYDLVATKAVKVAAEAVSIEFATDKLDVNVNNKVVWNVVDNEGNIVKLTDADIIDYSIKYVVLDKPTDAKVSVYDLTAAPFDGDGKMALTSNKVGNVTVQAIAQVQFAQATVDSKGKPAQTAVQTKYYTGTQVFAVGTEGTGDVVVMSIGSTEIVKNDKVSDMGVAPIVENGRTFVPYRAGLEALGATVAYDEATQSVTAEMNGTTVVMTIGSNVYTVNGVEKTMDVAPFISESRTMVPARFAAQAFGITVIPTQNPDGTTADVLYIM